MPAFTFEKISSPASTSAQPARVASKQANVGRSRTVITQMLDRFAVARLKRERELPPTLPRKPPPD